MINLKIIYVSVQEISLCSFFVKSFHILPRKKIYLLVILYLKLTNLCFVYIEVTFIMITLETSAKFCICFTKINIFLSAAPALLLILSVGILPNLKSFFLIISMRRLTIINNKNFNISRKSIIKILLCELLFTDHCRYIYFLFCFLLI